VPAVSALIGFEPVLVHSGFLGSAPDDRPGEVAAEALPLRPPSGRAACPWTMQQATFGAIPLPLPDAAPSGGEYGLQRVEACDLSGIEAAIGQPAHEHLEHRLAVAIEELHRAALAPHEGPPHEGDRHAAVGPDVAADRAVAV